MYRHHTNANLAEELEGRQMALHHARAIGLPASYANFHRNQIKAIKSELARRWRNQAVQRNRTRRQRAVQRKVKQAANKFLAPLYKPRTSTSPAGMRAARSIGRHMPNMSYQNAMAMARAMMRARRARQSASPRRRKN